MRRKENDYEDMAEALFKGSLALQATPMLKPAGRTTAALTRTATGFVGIGIAGATANVAFEMVKPRKRIGTKKRKRKGGN